MPLRNAFVLPAVLAAVAGAVLGYELGRERANTATDPPSTEQRLRRCPASAWARGGGTDYATAGMTCQQVNKFVLRDYRGATTANQGGGLILNGWICFQRSTAGRYSPVLNVCADGRRKLRFLIH